MFNIETIEDAKILKELTSSTDSERIKKLELDIQKLSKENEELLVVTQEQKKTIDKLTSSLVTPEQCRNIVFELIGNRAKNIAKNKGRINVMKEDTEEFEFTQAMQKKFNKIIVDGNNLIHHTIKNQKMKLPVSTIELLAIVEIYQYRQRKLLYKDQRNICKLFEINKVQFGKIYYNLKEGFLFKAIDEINNQIRKTNFTLKNGTIHIKDGINEVDTKIDLKTFKYLLNVYINTEQPYSAIYKLSKENKNIDPVHLLVVLKRNTSVSKLITESR